MIVHGNRPERAKSDHQNGANLRRVADDSVGTCRRGMPGLRLQRSQLLRLQLSMRQW